MSAVEEAVNCPVCLLPAFSAVISTCGHTICSECLERVEAKSVCVTCRKAAVKHTPNFVIRSLAEKTYPLEFQKWEQEQKLSTFEGVRQWLLQKDIHIVRGKAEEPFVNEVLQLIRSVCAQGVFDEKKLIKAMIHADKYSVFPCDSYIIMSNLQAYNRLTIRLKSRRYIVVIGDKMVNSFGRKRKRIQVDQDVVSDMV